MPIVEIPASAAFARLRSDPATARWPGDDASGARLEGAAEVACQPSFEIAPDDLIFTAGSCFARNIERRLVEVGLRTCMQGPEVVGKLAALGEQPPFFNKYNAAVIRQEFAWAAGEEAETRDLALIPSSDGQLLDGLLNPRRKAGAPAEQARALRLFTEGLYRRLCESRIVVITLGVAEVWRDLRTGLALNRAPPDGMIEADPGRFVLQVLDYADILRDLEAIHGVLSRRGHPDFRILITVSPVPLKATFRPTDVIAANAYSKAVQRAAVEAFVLAHGNVDYFPSYETVMLTDRPLAFTRDNRHVQSAVVDRVVDRFLKAYAPALRFEPSRQPMIRSSSPADVFARLLKTADERMLQRRFAEAAEEYARAIELYGDRHETISTTELRLRCGTCLAKSGATSQALEQLHLALAAGDDNRAAIFLKCADRLFQCGDPAASAEALAVAEAKGAKAHDLAVRASRLPRADLQVASQA